MEGMGAAKDVPENVDRNIIRSGSGTTTPALDTMVENGSFANKANTTTNNECRISNGETNAMANPWAPISQCTRRKACTGDYNLRKGGRQHERQQHQRRSASSGMVQ